MISLKWNHNILVEMRRESCLEPKSGNKFNEMNVAADDHNGLAIVVTQEIHKDNKAGNFGHAQIINIIQ